jgi:hypothetical protein
MLGTNARHLSSGSHLRTQHLHEQSTLHETQILHEPLKGLLGGAGVVTGRLHSGGAIVCHGVAVLPGPLPAGHGLLVVQVGSKNRS